MKLSARTRYGLRAMMYLAKVGRKVPLAKISSEESIPYDFLEKILTDLRNAKFLKSFQGQNGGYILAKNPSRIKVGDIVKVLENDLELIACLRKKSICPEKNCKARIFWKQLRNKIISALNSISLTQLREGNFSKIPK